MQRGLFSLYSWRFPLQLLRLLAAQNYRPWPYISTFWHTQDFSQSIRPKRAVWPWSAAALYLAVALELYLGAMCIYLGLEKGLVGGIEFGAALIVGYPLVLAHILLVPAVLGRLLRPKALGKAVLVGLLARQVIRLRKRHEFKVVAVAGSVGKTSTKIAIARLLGATQRVRWQEGNYNDPVTVPLIFFGHAEPHIFNVFAWTRILLSNEMAIRREYPYDYVVAELGTDTPGTIEQFAYIRPELAVITAVTEEHMEYFGTLNNVAKEELAVLAYAHKTLVNVDDTPAKYIKGKIYTGYSLGSGAQYYAAKRKAKHLQGQAITFHSGKKQLLTSHITLLGDQGAKIAVAAVAVAHELGLSKDNIAAGVEQLAPFAGRMQVLPGIKNSTLIDDTYNASPVAYKAALEVLYAGSAPQRIAILGSMNELGDYSPQAHHDVGAYCDANKLDLVVTIGKDAEAYLAPVAAERGCTVVSYASPYDAGEYVRSQLKDGAVVLAKGSQNRVFAEEALKELLENPGDVNKLVRQSAYWLKIKSQQFRP